MKKGSHHSSATIKKLRKIGGTYSFEHMEKMRTARTHESFRKQSKTMKEKFPAGPTHYNFGSHRTEKSKKKMSKSAKGKHCKENNGNWNGGRYRESKRGYIFILQPYHPFCDNKGYILEHRLIIEKMIKRFLCPSEPCHHINKNKSDNRAENLMAFKSQSAHNSFEAGHKINQENIIFDGRNII